MTGAGARAAAAVLLVLAGLGLGPAEGATPRPVEFAPPPLAIPMAPIPMGLERPRLEPPEPPPIEPPAVDLGRAPIPRFGSMVTKPLPPVADPGGFPCTFAFGNAETIAKCGLQRLAAGDLREARDAFEESLRVNPQGPQAPMAYVWLGELALQEATGPMSPAATRADRWYRLALPLAPPRELAVHAEIGLGILALRRAATPEAAAALERALRAVPPQPVALVARFLLGVARLQQDRPAEALALWDEVAQSGASGAILGELPFWRGVALARSGETERGLDELQRFVTGTPATHPLRGDALVQIGWLALERGGTDDAIRRFREAEAGNPRPDLRPQIRAGLVSAYLRAGDTVRAKTAARQLKAETPRDPLASGALLLIAESDRTRGALGEATDGYREVLLLPLPPPVQDFVRYRLGEVLERDGRLPEAKDHYRELRDRGRDEAIAQRASYRLGLIALRENDAGAARRESEALLRGGLLPDLQEGVLLLVAESATRGADPNRAVAVLRLALRDYPDSPRAPRTRLALGWALAGDGDSESALREWRTAAGQADLETRTLALLAVTDVTLQQGREAEALDALRAITPAPGVPRGEVIGVNRGILAVRTRSYADAVAALEPLAPRVTDLPLQAVARRTLGVALYELGRYDAAERQFRQAASLAPQEASSWLGAGLAALAQRRLAEADDALGRARYAPVDVATSALYGMVLVAVQRGDRDAFRARGTEFVDRFPRHPAAPSILYGLAAAALDRGDVADGQAWTQRLLREQSASEYGTDALLRLAAAAARRPDVARQAYRDLLARPASADVRGDAWLGLADTALAAGDHAEAQRAAEGFIKETPAADPRIPGAYRLLVRAQEAQGQRDRALASINTFLGRFPKDRGAPELELTRGRLLADARRWDEAKPALEAARRADDAAVAAPAEFWLGETLRARGEHEAAIAAYLTATYVYRDSPWAARGLEGAAQSYVARQMPREAGVLLRKLAAWPGVDPALAAWARDSLTRLGASADPAVRAPGPPGPPPRP